VAKKIEAKIKTQLIEGKWLDRLPGQEKTFKEMMERYMTEHSQPRKKSWRRDKISLLHLLPFFKGHFLRDITSESISQYKAQRYQEGAKPSTLNRELSLMKHAFDLALKEWNWIRENPMSKVKMERENNERDRVLSYEDEERLLAASPPWLKEIIQFALDTGAREREILSLQWPQVDLFRKVMSIRQEKTGFTKSIPLTSTVFELLKSKAKVRHLHCSLVVPSENDTQITASNLGRALRNALTKTEIKDFRFHDLRHTFASRLAQRGIDLYLIQKLLGHREPRMVQRYAHHSVESLRAGIEVLEKVNCHKNGTKRDVPECSPNSA
jgi:integrase